MGPVELRRLDEELLARLLAVAVADAEPDEAMPPVEGPPGWTPARRAAFVAYHRDRALGLDGPHAEAGYAVLAGGEPVGVARVARRADGTLELGLWLARSARGRGVGTACLGPLLAEAHLVGGDVIAETTTANPAALSVLARHGARLTQHAGGHVTADLPPAPPRPET